MQPVFKSVLFIQGGREKMLDLNCKACEKNKSYLLFCDDNPDAVLWAADWAAFAEVCRLGVSYEIRDSGNGEAIFQLTGFQWRPEHADQKGGCRLPVLRARKDVGPGKLKDLIAVRQKFSLAVITLSDKGAQGLRKDASGPEIIRILSESLHISFFRNFLIPDEQTLLKALLADLAFNQKFDLVCTTGGTGIGPRDITPQVTESLLDLELPGFAQAMMAASLAETPNAMLSRARAGLMGQTLIINLPGSPKAVRCNLQAVLPALKHALEKAGGDTSDCGGN